MSSASAGSKSCPRDGRGCTGSIARALNRRYRDRSGDKPAYEWTRVVFGCRRRLKNASREPRAVGRAPRINQSGTRVSRVYRVAAADSLWPLLLKLIHGYLPFHSSRMIAGRKDLRARVVEGFLYQPRALSLSFFLIKPLDDDARCVSTRHT